MRQSDYGTGDTFLNDGGAGAGTGDDQNVFTLQVAVEF